jgi:hypothetical protein
MKLRSCRFANAVKIGNSEQNYVTSDKYEIELVSDTVMRIEEKSSGAVSYSSLFNAPYWTMDERELELEADGVPPAESLDIAKTRKKK